MWHIKFESNCRTRIYDVLRGKGDWIETHNGRAIVNDTLRDSENGVSEKELHEKYAEAMKNRDYTRLVVYAGTGSGLVTKEKQTVVEILDELDDQLLKAVKDVNERLNRL